MTRDQEKRGRLPRGRVALEVLAVLAFLLLVRAWQGRTLASGEAPRLRATMLTGEAVSVGGAGEQPTVLWFFATWCGVCHAMEHNVRALARGHRVLAVVSQSGTAEEVRASLRARGFEVPVVLDPSGSLAARFGVGAFPTTFVLDRSGTIRAREVGYVTELGLRARLRWASW